MVSFKQFKAHGSLPRSSDNLAVNADALSRSPIRIGVSHRWLRPEINDPDDGVGTKFKTLVDGIERLALLRNWDTNNIAIWLDFACIDQDNEFEKAAGNRSTCSYIAECNALVIPVSKIPTNGAVHELADGYCESGWTRLEALCYYVMSTLGKDSSPLLYALAPNGRAKSLAYIMLHDQMPRGGKVPNVAQLDTIEQLQNQLLDALHSEALLRGLAGCIDPCVSAALVAAAGAGEAAKVQELLDVDVDVNNHLFIRSPHIAPLIAAARAGHQAIVQMLIEARAVLEVRDHRYGATPVRIAAQWQHDDVVATLLAASARTDLIDYGARERTNELRELTSSMASGDDSRRTQVLSQVGITINNFLESIDARTPFVVVPFLDFKAHREIPRSSTGLAKEVPEDCISIFVSHRWLRPAKPHPDDASASKFKAVVLGVERLALLRQWRLEKVTLWLDYSCIDQDNDELKQAGIRSLLGYVAKCNLMLVPCGVLPVTTAVHCVPSYGDRAWTRVEAFCFFVISLLRDMEQPDLYVVASSSELKRLMYVMLHDKMPSGGDVFNPADKAAIVDHESSLLRLLWDYAHHRTSHSLIACAGLSASLIIAAKSNDVSCVQTLLRARVDVNDHTFDSPPFIAPLIASARLGNTTVALTLIAAKAILDFRDQVDGATALGVACWFGHAEIASLLVSSRARVDVPDADGAIPLLNAAKHGHKAVVQAMLNASTFRIDDALEAAEKNGHSDTSKIILAVKAAQQNGSSECILQ